MVIKANVTAEEHARVVELAKAENKSISAYIKSRALNEKDTTAEEAALMKFIEQQAGIANSINQLSIRIYNNKVIFEEDIFELRERMAELEKISREALKNGHAR